MAAQSNPYDLHPQPTPHAKQDHTHRWRRTHEHLFDQRCVECDVPKSIADLKRIRDLEKRVAQLEDAMLQIYRLPPRGPGMRYGGLPSAREIAADMIALSQWRDEQSNDRGGE